MLTCGSYTLVVGYAYAFFINNETFHLNINLKMIIFAKILKN